MLDCSEETDLLILHNLRLILLIGYLNVKGLRNKISDVSAFLNDFQFEYLVVSGTNLAASHLLSL